MPESTALQKVRRNSRLRSGAACVPGPDPALGDDMSVVVRMAGEIGYPVIVKAAGGGGGRVMQVIRSADEVEGAVPVRREEARRAFGTPALYLPQFADGAALAIPRISAASSRVKF
jgi:acetyl-CoA carboxylase biotin carboxylase subunit